MSASWATTVASFAASERDAISSRLAMVTLAAWASCVFIIFFISFSNY
jgi:hypothetical protein